MQPAPRVYWRASLLGPLVAVRIVCGSANPLGKTVFATFENSATGGQHAQESVVVRFVEVQPGFLQLLLT